LRLCTKNASAYSNFITLPATHNFHQKIMMYIFRVFILSFLITALGACQNAIQEPDTVNTAKIPIKVVVVTMFELEELEGDAPGEFQYWVERMPLDSTIAFPQGYRDLRYNAEKGVLGICTGIGTAKAAASIMALGMDPRFDLTNAYFLVAGIAGVDPEDASTGSAVWAEWLVDGDLSHEIDPREMPEEWETGYLPLRKTEPYELPVKDEPEGEVFALNKDLVQWAYQLTQDVELVDNEEIKRMREQYTNYPNAQQPPKVMVGDQLAAMTYWHGKLMNDWANKWVLYWTNGEGNFVTSAMEETGTAQALAFLDNAGKVDAARFLVLRTASNFTMQYEGITAAQSLSGEKLDGGGYSAFIPAIEAAYRVGSKVVNELAENWATYRDQMPTVQ